MKRFTPFITCLPLAALFALAGWTSTSQSEWFKGIIYAGSGKIQLTDATGNLAPLGNLTSGGNVAITGTLAVTGATTLRSTLAVSGAQTNAGALNVVGAIGVTGAATLRSTLNVTGATTLSGALTATGATFAGQLIGKGTATNDSAPTGYIGEQFGPISRALASAVALTTATACNVGAATCPSTGGTQSFTLTAGDWEVRGAVGFVIANTTTITRLTAAISATSATLPATSTTALPTAGEVRYEWSQASAAPGSSVPITIQIPPFRVTVATTKTLYLVAQATFATSTATTFGYMDARRIR